MCTTLPVQHNQTIGGKVDGNKTGHVMTEHYYNGWRDKGEPLILIAQLRCGDYKLGNYVEPGDT
jgi:hypothetical protein